MQTQRVNRLGGFAWASDDALDDQRWRRMRGACWVDRIRLADHPVHGFEFLFPIDVEPGHGLACLDRVAYLADKLDADGWVNGIFLGEPPGAEEVSSPTDR